MQPITVATLRRMKRDGEKVAVLTAYDAAFAAVLDAAGVEVILVGDSLGMVVQGRDTTVPVGIDDMVYHTAAVRRGAKRPLVIADMPFMSYASVYDALHNAARLMQEGGAHMVKLEGGRHVVETTERLADHGVPVCGHLGLLPQSIHKIGGYRVQGREPASAESLLRDARDLEQAGADALVLECVPAELAARVSEMLAIPVIGIGAGTGCDAQVLVLYDLLGITPGRHPKFARNFMDGAGSIQAAVEAYVAAVKEGTFPGPHEILE